MIISEILTRIIKCYYAKLMDKFIVFNHRINNHSISINAYGVRETRTGVQVSRAFKSYSLPCDAGEWLYLK